MKMSKKQKAQHILFNGRALLAQHRGIKILAAEGAEDQNKQGIHLLMPTQRDLDDAIDTAERDLFDVIWVHGTKDYFNNG